MAGLLGYCKCGLLLPGMRSGVMVPTARLAFARWSTVVTSRLLLLGGPEGADHHCVVALVGLQRDLRGGQVESTVGEAGRLDTRDNLGALERRWMV